ncbi:MAG: single-stranded DNA-binding protein [bacterium]|nr:single-stranded DNA-binding protein [bacterium]
MFSLNRATVIGNLTRDPELRYTPNGQAVASFAIATNRRWKNQSGEMQDEVQYHEIVAWGKLGEIANQTLAKGKKAYIEGRIQTRSWEGPDGAKRNKTEIVAENLIALSPRDNFGQTGDSDFLSEAQESPPETKKPGKTDSSPSGSKSTAKKDSDEDSLDDNSEIKLEDIPF